MCWAGFGWACSAWHAAQSAGQSVGHGAQAVGGAVKSGAGSIVSGVKNIVKAIFVPSDAARDVITRGHGKPATAYNELASSGSASKLAYGGGALKSPGVYQFTMKNGDTYTGMSTVSIANRLQAHIRNGLLDSNASVNYETMTGATRTQIRTMEQIWLNQTGGIGAEGVGNKINSIKEEDWPMYDIDEPILPFE